MSFRSEHKTTRSLETVFAKGAWRFLADVSRQKDVALDSLVRYEPYTVHLGTDGKLSSPDAGRYKVVVPGDLDVVSLRVSGQDLPAFLRVEGDLRVDPRTLMNLTGKTLDVGGDIRLVVDREMTQEDQQRLTDDIETLARVNFGGEVLVEITGIVADTQRQREVYRRRLAQMSQQEFVDYLLVHAREYGEMTGDQAFQSERPGFASAKMAITLKPEWRGMTREEREAHTHVSPEDAAAYEQMLAQAQQDWQEREGEGVTCTQGSMGFLHWRIRDVKPADGVRHKRYLNLEDPAHRLSRHTINAMIQAVIDSGFQGQVKIATWAKQMQEQFDGLVIHGADADEVQTGTEAAIAALTHDGVKVRSMDEGVDKDERSNSERLAEQIKRAYLEKRRLARRKE